ncbi:hypothetical protein [Rhizobium sp. SSA_523]|uniref:hypothetical protein n=1 Tax=Rhizobium sp. SSA_523 TaxID=2952477 RepID=UPI002090CC0A|nr:hypothetical protein [Rhizobium sp. SSA_523]MCO5733028.1 hypothetical protein [Rhizobium sp. SSA_523]WKC23909.1 hypothetical protein QTJ18_24585 [Rhizobium sp. SSA_523]
MTPPLSRFLKDFSAPPPLPPVVTAISEDFGAGFAFEDVHHEPPVDLEAEKARAYAEGEAAAEARLKAQYDAERALSEAENAKAESLLRARLEGEAVTRLETRLRESVDQVADQVCAELAPLLAPVLEEALAKRAVKQLAAAVKQALMAEKAAQITVRGPQSLFKQLQDAMGEDAGDLRHIESADLDLSVDINEAVLVTRLSAWAGSVKKVLG